MITLKDKKTWAYAVVLLTIALVIRLSMFLFYQPVSFPDTGEYFDHAEFLIGMNPSWVYKGARTPGYPVLIILSGFNDANLWIMQATMGLIITAILFELTYIFTRNVKIALICAISYTLSLNMIFYEATLLTELPAGFCVMLSLLFIAYFRLELVNRGHNANHLLLLTAMATIAGFMIRPQLLFLVPFYSVYLVILLKSKTSDFRLISSKLLAFLIPCLVFWFGWSMFNQVKIGHFSFSTVTGYNLMYHTGDFVELAPEEYRTVREIYVAERDKEMTSTGATVRIPWNAGKEIQARLKKTLPDVSDVFTRLSIDLILRKPDRYIISVALANIDSWKVYNSWDLALIKEDWLRQTLETLWFVEKRALILCNILFLGLSGILFLISIWKKVDLEGVLLFPAVIIGGSIFTALLIHGANHRYAIPFQPAMLLSIFAGFDIVFRLMRGELNSAKSSLLPISSTAHSSVKNGNEAT